MAASSEDSYRFRAEPDELLDAMGVDVDDLPQSPWWREVVDEAETLMWARLRQHGAETGAAR